MSREDRKSVFFFFTSQGALLTGDEREERGKIVIDEMVINDFRHPQTKMVHRFCFGNTTEGKVAIC